MAVGERRDHRGRGRCLRLHGHDVRAPVQRGEDLRRTDPDAGDHRVVLQDDAGTGRLVHGAQVGCDHVRIGTVHLHHQPRQVGPGGDDGRAGLLDGDGGGPRGEPHHERDGSGLGGHRAHDPGLLPGVEGGALPEHAEHDQAGRADAVEQAHLPAQRLLVDLQPRPEGSGKYSPQPAGQGFHDRVDSSGCPSSSRRVAAGWRAAGTSRLLWPPAANSPSGQVHPEAGQNREHTDPDRERAPSPAARRRRPRTGRVRAIRPARGASLP